jgi:hypothetical protein
VKFIFVSPVLLSHDGDDRAACVPTPADFTGGPAAPAAVALKAATTIEHPSANAVARCLRIAPPADSLG